MGCGRVAEEFLVGRDCLVPAGALHLPVRASAPGAWGYQAVEFQPEPLASWEGRVIVVAVLSR